METLKRLISTPYLLVTLSILIYAFVTGKVNGIVALLIIGLQLIFVLTDSGHKKLWK